MGAWLAPVIIAAVGAAGSAGGNWMRPKKSTTYRYDHDEFGDMGEAGMRSGVYAGRPVSITSQEHIRERKGASFLKSLGGGLMSAGMSMLGGTIGSESTSTSAKTPGAGDGGGSAKKGIYIKPYYRHGGYFPAKDSKPDARKWNKAQDGIKVEGKKKDIGYIYDILNQHSDKNFVKRVFNPEKSLPLQDGKTATHLMEYGEWDGKYHVYPAVVEDEDGKLKRFSSHTDAIKHAQTKGESIVFDKEDDAKWFSKHYKDVWDHPPYDKESRDTDHSIERYEPSPFSITPVYAQNPRRGDMIPEDMDYGSIDIPSGHYDRAVAPNEQWMYPNLSGDTRKTMIESTNEKIAAGLPIPIVDDVMRLGARSLKGVAKGAARVLPKGRKSIDYRNVDPPQDLLDDLMNLDMGPSKPKAIRGGDDIIIARYKYWNDMADIGDINLEKYGKGQAKNYKLSSFEKEFFNKTGKLYHQELNKITNKKPLENLDDLRKRSELYDIVKKLNNELPASERIFTKYGKITNKGRELVEKFMQKGQSQKALENLIFNNENFQRTARARKNIADVDPKDYGERFGSLFRNPDNVKAVEGNFRAHKNFQKDFPDEYNLKSMIKEDELPFYRYGGVISPRIRKATKGIVAISPIHGPSHEDGGVPMRVNGKSIEAEGGEYVFSMEDGSKVILNQKQMKELKSGKRIQDIIKGLPRAQNGFYFDPDDEQKVLSWQLDPNFSRSLKKPFSDAYSGSYTPTSISFLPQGSIDQNNTDDGQYLSYFYGKERPDEDYHQYAHNYADEYDPENNEEGEEGNKKKTDLFKKYRRSLGASLGAGIGSSLIQGMSALADKRRIREMEDQPLEKAQVRNIPRISFRPVDTSGTNRQIDRLFARGLRMARETGRPELIPSLQSELSKAKTEYSSKAASENTRRMMATDQANQQADLANQKMKMTSDLDYLARDMKMTQMLSDAYGKAGQTFVDSMTGMVNLGGEYSQNRLYSEVAEELLKSGDYEGLAYILKNMTGRK